MRRSSCAPAERPRSSMHSVTLVLANVDPTVFDAAERAVLALAVEMTRNVEVSAATMASVRAALR